MTEKKRSGLSLRKRIAFWGVSLSVAGGAAFLAGEVAVRLFAPQPEPMRWLEPHERYGHVMKPNFRQDYPFPGTDYVMGVQTNSLGLRDDEPIEATENVETILFMGDSFAFGFGVDIDDRFDHTLKRRLEEQGRSFRFINTGTPAWGTIQATRFVADRLEEFNPDIIVLLFCSNDPSDDAYFLKKGQSFDTILFPGKRFLRNNSHFYRFLTQRAFALLHRFYTARKQERQPEATVDAQSAALISEGEWEQTFGTLDAFLETYRKIRPDGVFILQATSPTHADTRTHLQRYADRTDTVYVDLFDSVQPLAQEDRRLAYDGHWSIKMHTISGDALAEVLLRNSAD